MQTVFGNKRHIRIRYYLTHKPAKPLSDEAVTYSTDTPEESNATEACRGYNAAKDQPRQIELQKINITGCIQKIGTDQNNAVAVPTNVNFAGWFVDSPIPGQEGVSLIDGHVIGRYSKAIFTRLNELNAGDIVRIQYGDHSWKSFEIVQKESYTNDKAASEMFYKLPDVGKQLTLITCTGKWLQNDKTYDHRLIVRTKLVD